MDKSHDTQVRVTAAISALLKNNKPFYAHFILNSRIVYSDKYVPTAMVGLTKTGPIFFFNPDFVSKQTTGKLCGLVEHEIMHLLFEHTQVWPEGKRPSTEEQLEHKTQNIAMDCAINQWIAELPEGVITLDEFRKSIDPKAQEKQTWEYYYSLMKANPEQTSKMLPKVVNIDEHGNIEHPDLLSPEELDMAKRVIADASNKALKSSAGVAPEHLLKTLQGLNAPPMVNWKSQLRNFVARMTASSTQATRKLRNRRFGIEHPGKKKKRELTLSVCADSSGSVDDQLFMSFLNEIDHIAKSVKKIHFIDADTEVASTYVIKKSGKTKKERMGNGGTAYNPALKKSQELNVDAIIYFGDGDCADTPEKPRQPVLWVLPEGCNCPANFGTVVRIK